MDVQISKSVGRINYFSVTKVHFGVGGWVSRNPNIVQILKSVGKNGCSLTIIRLLEGMCMILPAYFYIIILVSTLQILKTDPAQSLEREVFVYFFNDPDKLRHAIDKLNAQVQAQMVK